MKPNFVQLSCTRGKDFLIVSNTRLMARDFCTPFEALDVLSNLAAEYHKKGYTTLWFHEEASESNMVLFEPYWSSKENKQRMGYHET